MKARSDLHELGPRRLSQGQGMSKICKEIFLQIRRKRGSERSKITACGEFHEPPRAHSDVEFSFGKNTTAHGKKAQPDTMDSYLNRRRWLAMFAFIVALGLPAAFAGHDHDHIYVTMVEYLGYDRSSEHYMIKVRRSTQDGSVFYGHGHHDGGDYDDN